ncbi:preprotein translocase subunit SecG [Candidatus Poribacteria bacterium]|nr:preprotein translocase subunit SecG [Candidatus Poribacteria bacterium]
MSTLLTIIHIIVAIILILIGVFYSSKSDATAFLGGSASSDIFGGKGPLSFITKTTAVLAALFFVTSTLLAVIQKNKTSSIIQETKFNIPPVPRPENPKQSEHAFHTTSSVTPAGQAEQVKK